MLMTKLFSMKMTLFALALLAILWMLPENLNSLQAYFPTHNQTELTQSSESLISNTKHLLAAAPDNAKSLPPRKVYTPKSTKPSTTTPLPPPIPEGLADVKKPSMVTQGVLLSLLSLLPFIIMVLTSFLKIVVVLGLLRTALGVQQAPPNQVINGVAFMLSLFIMYPTAAKMYDAAKPVMMEYQTPDSILSPDSSTYVIAVAKAAIGPLREFFLKNSSPKHQAIFYRLAYRGLPEEYRDALKPTDLIVMIPTYITGQLKEAFEIGVLIYIPFFVIDLVTSNILLAMGMMMLSPVTISMPLKLFLLVMLDGWTILIEGLVKTFQ